MFNEYFGGGMNSIVFQEMREARGLAYTAYAYVISPNFKDDNYAFLAFIASQNDKLRDAALAFQNIIDNLPESESAFEIAKEGILSRLRTERVTGLRVLEKYRSCRRLGISEPEDKAIFEAISNMTLEDVKAFKEKWLNGNNYYYGILGDPANIDQDFLKTLGPVKTVSLEEIFGF